MKDGNTKLIEDFLEMHRSLLVAVDFAGGSGAQFKTKNLEHLNLLEVMAHLAPNGVRFYCSRTHTLQQLSAPGSLDEDNLDDFGQSISEAHEEMRTYSKALKTQK